MQYSLDEYTLIPKKVSNVVSRSEIRCTDVNGKLPVFVSPMTCILNRSNIQTFQSSQVTPIYPIWNGENLKQRLFLTRNENIWISLTLKEFEENFTQPNRELLTLGYCKILIDCANGHMQRLYDVVKKAKSIYSNITVMVGNIANPRTYGDCCEAGVDFVRLGIGGGSGCTTSVQTGFHTSLGWLITNILPIKKECAKEGMKCSKIVADGGIDTTSKAIKALALGADYVMMGKCFAQCEEACGPTESFGMWRKYYGQASEEGQKDRFGEVRRYPEGTSMLLEVKTTLEKWTFAFQSALTSAMSYAGAFTLDEFIGRVQYDIISNHEFNAFNQGKEK